jgi:hypothetical protein
VKRTDANARRRAPGRRGAVLVLFVLSAPILMGLAVIAFDLGWVYLQEARLKAAGNAAATAAANRLAKGGSAADAVAAARAFAQANGIAISDADVQVNPEGNNPLLVRVAKTRRVGLFWGPVLGFSALDTRLDVYGMSHADVTRLHAGPATAGAGSGIVPLGVPHADLLPVVTSRVDAGEMATLIFDASRKFERGRRYLLKSGSQFRPDIQGLPGGASCEGPLDLPGDGSGAAKYKAHFLNGYGGAVSVLDRFASQPGNIFGATRDAVNARHGADPGATVSTVRPFSARVVVVPIVRTADTHEGDDLGTGVPSLACIPWVHSGQPLVEVIGLGKFLLDSYGAVENHGAVTGVFIDYVGKPPVGQNPAP